MRLSLLSRAGCGLCDRAAALLSDLGVEFDTIDIDREPALLVLYDEAIPVVLAGEQEVCRAPITAQSLRGALKALNPASRG